MLKKIPIEWRDADIAVGDLLERCYRVQRVILHQTVDGKKVVVVTPTPFVWGNR